MQNTETHNGIAYWVGDVPHEGERTKRTRVVPIEDDVIGIYLAVEVEDRDVFGNAIWIPYAEGTASHNASFNNHAIELAMFDWACQIGGRPAQNYAADVPMFSRST
jgi:hypothetical protein